MNDLQEALSGLHKRLRYRRRIGGDRIPLTIAQPVFDLIDMLEQKGQAANPEERLAHIAAELRGCTRCGLHRFRRNIVVGEGNPRARLVFVGEGPGEEEDSQGRPFVGPAGQLLTRIIHAMGLQREEVFIANVVKCRPPGNRIPKPEELEVCSPFLIEQLRAISPKVICALGRVAAQTLLQTQERISGLRSRMHPWHGMMVMPTFHPSYLLRYPEQKRAVWEDMKRVTAYLNE